MDHPPLKMSLKGAKRVKGEREREATKNKWPKISHIVRTMGGSANFGV